MATAPGVDQEVSVSVTRSELSLMIRGLAEALQAHIPEVERQELRALIQKIRTQTDPPKESDKPDAGPA